MGLAGGWWNVVGILSAQGPQRCFCHFKSVGVGLSRPEAKEAIDLWTKTVLLYLPLLSGWWPRRTRQDGTVSPFVAVRIFPSAPHPSNASERPSAILSSF